MTAQGKGHRRASVVTLKLSTHRWMAVSLEWAKTGREATATL